MLFISVQIGIGVVPGQALRGRAAEHAVAAALEDTAWLARLAFGGETLLADKAYDELQEVCVCLPWPCRCGSQPPPQDMTLGCGGRWLMAERGLPRAAPNPDTLGSPILLPCPSLPFPSLPFPVLFRTGLFARGHFCALFVPPPNGNFF